MLIFNVPFCACVGKTLQALAKKHGADIRLVWKNNPLPFHPRAKAGGTRGASGTRPRQIFGKCTMRSLPQNVALTGSMTKASPGATAKNAAWRKIGRVQSGTRESTKTRQAAVAADIALAQRIGAAGHANLFHQWAKTSRRAAPIENFEAAFNKALPKKANAAIQKTARNFLSPRSNDTLTKTGVDHIKSLLTKEEDAEAIRVPVGDAPVRGRKNARVTIVEFADFRYAYFVGKPRKWSRRFSENFPRANARVAFKQLPLPFLSARTTRCMQLRPTHRGNFGRCTTCCSKIEALGRSARRVRRKNRPQYRYVFKHDLDEKNLRTRSKHNWPKQLRWARTVHRHFSSTANLSWARYRSTVW